MTELQKYVFEKLKDKGLPTKSICAIMGNITKESGWNVNAIEKGNSIGYGLCQWSFGRRKELEQFGTDLDSQLNFLYQELKGNQYINKTGYVTKKNFLAGNGTIEELTRGFCFCWERPKFETSHIDKRIDSALKFYAEIGGLNPTTYYPMYKGNRISIVDALNSLGIDSSMEHRQKIAKANNIKKYIGRYDQNIAMLALLKRGRLVKEK